jgi:hypothetical protein
MQNENASTKAVTQIHCGSSAHFRTTPLAGTISGAATAQGTA